MYMLQRVFVKAVIIYAWKLNSPPKIQNYNFSLIHFIPDFAQSCKDQILATNTEVLVRVEITNIDSTYATSERSISTVTSTLPHPDNIYLYSFFF